MITLVAVQELSIVSHGLAQQMKFTQLRQRCSNVYFLSTSRTSRLLYHCLILFFFSCFSFLSTIWETNSINPTHLFIRAILLYILSFPNDPHAKTNTLQSVHILWDWIASAWNEICSPSTWIIKGDIEVEWVISTVGIRADKSSH